MIHELLKGETASAHQAIERELRFLLGPLDRGTYEAFLARSLGFHRPLERRFAELPEWGPPCDLRARRKAHLLADDLRHLGWGDGDLAGLPECDDLPPVGSLAEALGCLYVLEGSTLGGRIIAPRVARSLGLVDGGGCSYFQCYGDDVGPMWAGYLRLLERYCERQPDALAVVGSARRTFSCLHRWLTETGDTQWPTVGHLPGTPASRRGANKSRSTSPA